MSKASTTIVACVAAVGLMAGCFYLGYHSSDKSWQLKWSQRDAADIKAEKEFTEQQRRIELQRQGVIDDIQNEADKQLAAARTNAARADAESERLRAGINSAIARLQSGGHDTGAPSGSPARDRTGLLLTELFREIDVAAGEYAAEADRRGIAGLTCERAYDSMRATAAGSGLVK